MVGPGTDGSSLAKRLLEMDRQEVQRSVAQVLMATSAMVALSGWGYVQSTNSANAALTAVCVAGSFVSLWIGAFLPAVSRRSRLTFLALWWVSLTALLYLTPWQWVQFGFIFPMLAAGVFLRPWASPLAAVPCAGVCVLVRGTDGIAAALVIMLASVWQWATLQPFYAMLERYSRRSLDANQLAEQLRDERGKLNRTIKDLSASYQLLRNMNDELNLARREADSLRDLRHRFATNLSHELRTPLNIVLGFSRLIYRKPQLYGYGVWNEALRRDLAEVQRNAAHLSQLVDDVIDLARVDAFAMPVRREVINVAGLIDETLGMVHSLAEDKGLEMRSECDADLPALSVDPLRIRQVLYNLLTNAIRFTDHGRVTVSATHTVEEVVVTVADSGRGVAPADLPTIFDEFHQVGRPKTDPDAGKGLGLAIAKRFVQLHGGRIWVESEPGVGSTFHFSLPTGDKQTSRVGQTTPLPLTARACRPRVLVAGNGGQTGGSLAAYIGRRVEGYDFADAAAWQALGGLPPAAVLVDSRVLGATGLRHSSRAAMLPSSVDAQRDVPVIYCPLPGSEWQAGHAGFCAVLTKPVEAEEVLAAIARVTTPGRRSRLLLVDDDRGFVQYLSRVIEDDAMAGGLWIEPPVLARAYCGADALAQMDQERPDLVLMDLLMSDMTGFDVLERMRDRPDLSDVPVLAVTAATPGEDEITAKGALFAVWCGRGFAPGVLFRLLEATLSSCTAGRAVQAGVSYSA